MTHVNESVEGAPAGSTEMLPEGDAAKAALAGAKAAIATGSPGAVGDAADLEEDEEDEEEDEEDGDAKTQARRESINQSLGSIAKVLGGRAPKDKTVRKWTAAASLFTKLRDGYVMGGKKGAEKRRELDPPATARLVLKFLKRGGAAAAVPHTVCMRFEWSKLPDALRQLATDYKIAPEAFFVALGLDPTTGKAKPRFTTELLSVSVPMPAGMAPPAIPPESKPAEAKKPESPKGSKPEGKGGKPPHVTGKSRGGQAAAAGR